MKVTARGAWSNELTHLLVKSNPLGAFQNMPVLKYVRVPSIRVQVWNETFGMWNSTVIDYETITHFLRDWHVVKAQTHRIRLPLLRRTYGLGDVFALFAERLPLWFKAKFNGCLDRREWWNWLLQVTPLHPTHAQISTVLFDHVMDIRHVLRARGENPFDYKEAPKCDVCGTWVATHVIQSKAGAGYLVCDKPRCQDAVMEYEHAH